MFAALLSAARAEAEADRSGSTPHLPNAPLLAFGDSLTDGVGGAGENYPRRLAALLKRPVINAGIPGDTTGDGLRRLQAALARERPELLILTLGLNDFLRKVPETEIRRNLVAMLALAQQQGVSVLLVAVPVPGSVEAHPLYAEVAEASGAVLDASSLVRVLSHPALKADLVHPNREGYRELADGLARTIREHDLAR